MDEEKSVLRITISQLSPLLFSKAINAILNQLTEMYELVIISVFIYFSVYWCQNNHQQVNSSPALEIALVANSK